MNVQLITHTSGAIGSDYEGKSLDEIVVGIARLSTSKEGNELFKDPAKLIRHCAIEQHWSVFTTVNLGFMIECSRAIGRQILRHGFRPQEFSQRYSVVETYEPFELMKQAKNNRQSSSEVIDYFGVNFIADESVKDSFNSYNKLIESGVSRETARNILPECAMSRIYINGTLREFITYLNVRLHKHTEKKHREVAEEIKNVFIQKCPIISEAFFNFESHEDIHILERLVLEKFGVYQDVISKIK